MHVRTIDLISNIVLSIHEEELKCTKWKKETNPLFTRYI